MSLALIIAILAVGAIAIIVSIILLQRRAAGAPRLSSS